LVKVAATVCDIQLQARVFNHAWLFHH
jgi:hypothetical protein